MEMRVISADSHMMEPANLWETRLDTKLRDKAPKVVQSETGKGYLFVAPGIRPAVTSATVRPTAIRVAFM